MNVRERFAHLVTHPTDVLRHESAPVTPRYDLLADNPDAYSQQRVMEEGTWYTIRESIQHTATYLADHKREFATAALAVAAGILMASEIRNIINEPNSILEPQLS